MTVGCGTSQELDGQGSVPGRNNDGIFLIATASGSGAKSPLQRVPGEQSG
jgi:hypothetical protein